MNNHTRQIRFGSSFEGRFSGTSSLQHHKLLGEIRNELATQGRSVSNSQLETMHRFLKVWTVLCGRRPSEFLWIMRKRLINV